MNDTLLCTYPLRFHSVDQVAQVVNLFKLKGLLLYLAEKDLNVLQPICSCLVYKYKSISRCERCLQHCALTSPSNRAQARQKLYPYVYYRLRKT